MREGLALRASVSPTRGRPVRHSWAPASPLDPSLSRYPFASRHCGLPACSWLNAGVLRSAGKAEGAWRGEEGKGVFMPLQVGKLRHWGDHTPLPSPGGWQVPPGPAAAVLDPASPQTRAGALQRGRGPAGTGARGPLGAFLRRKPGHGGFEGGQ